ncbi:FAD-binding protein [Eggerthella sp. YY7918]|uniref:FAD-binding protein n=1 Tax=Eggerthella sp. (strain YY7918) TaxID=502558 RepID=UPI0002171326|nr:FAD-binding protein [Eggerthella sp. YY7918]BAK45872.1 succinate dehydrogenase [Eggerthella sp. YY7918]
MELDRRNFLKGAALTAVGAVGATALAGCAPTSKEDADAAKQSAGTPDGEAYNTAAAAQRKWSFEIPPEPIADSDIKETIEADLVVVGCGTSGLMTANSAAEAGVDTIIVSASTKPVSRGGSNNAVYCKAFEEQGYPRVPVEQYQKEIFFQTHKVDQRKWYLHYNNSETAMNWAIDLMEKAGYGITIEIGTPDDEDSLYLQRTAAVGWNLNGQTPPEEGLEVVTGKMQPLFVWELARHLEEDLGGKIYYKNIAEQLIREDDNTGRVTAVICKREDGSYAKYVGKKAIVLATGDFSGDRDMMQCFCPETAQYVMDDVYDKEPDWDQGFKYGGIYKGQGQKMGLWVGAAWQKSFPNCTMGAYWGPGPRNLYSNHMGLLVDRDGQRYMNEDCDVPVASQHIMMLPERKAYAIWDAGYAKHEPISGDWTNDSMMTGEEAITAAVASWDESASGKNPNFVKGDTIEEVVEKLGLPKEAVETVKRYNELAAKGVDEDFHKDPKHLHAIEEGPFYGEVVDNFGFLTVLGGLNTNVHMQVCDADDKPIPGLYNVGTMVGDMFSGTYSFMIEGANYGMTCVTFGYLTGKYIAENE